MYSQDPLTLDLVEEACKEKDTWNQAVGITENGDFGIPLFVLMRKWKSRKIGLLFDYGKCLKQMGILTFD